jgi:hypothetical protein
VIDYRLVLGFCQPSAPMCFIMARGAGFAEIFLKSAYENYICGLLT